jgi:hypothetical protein
MKLVRRVRTTPLRHELTATRREVSPKILVGDNRGPTSRIYTSVPMRADHNTALATQQIFKNFRHPVPMHRMHKLKVRKLNKAVSAKRFTTICRSEQIEIECICITAKHHLKT